MAIADVGHYVPIGSALDEEANARGNSVYFPERVMPCFECSNGLCSLKPQVDRLAMVCEMSIVHPSVSESTFYGAVIPRIHDSPTQVDNVLEEGWCEGLK